MQLIRLLVVLLQAVYAVSDETTKYKVKYHHAQVPRNIAESLVDLNHNLTQQGQFEIIDIKRPAIHEKYICLLPPKHQANDGNVEDSDVITLPATNSSEALLKRQALKKQAVEEITKSFTTKSCNFAFGVAGYWTFAYCYGDKVIQFHSDLTHHFKTGKHKAEQPDFVYLLGKFPGSPSKTDKNDFENRLSHTTYSLNADDFLLNDEVDQFNDPLNQVDIDTPKQTFIQQTLYQGTTCDETREPRQIDVIYKCDPTKEMVDIAEVHEVNICKYQMIINVPRLCSIQEFRDNPSKIKTADIDCKLIDQWSSVSMKRDVEFHDFFGYPEQLAKNQYFPVYKDNKINLADYSLKPLGGGFFFGFRKEKIHTENPYFNSRNILLFNGKYSDVRELLQKVGQVFVRALDHKIPSPIVLGEDRYSVLSLKDSFVVWYELYNEFGKLIGMVRIMRDSNHTDGRILLNLIDPLTMTDHDGQEVVIERFDAPNNQWNFQSFLRPPTPDEKDSKDLKDTFYGENTNKPVNTDSKEDSKDNSKENKPIQVINADGHSIEDLVNILGEFMKGENGVNINLDEPIDMKEIVEQLFHTNNEDEKKEDSTGATDVQRADNVNNKQEEVELEQEQERVQQQQHEQGIEKEQEEQHEQVLEQQQQQENDDTIDDSIESSHDGNPIELEESQVDTAVSEHDGDHQETHTDMFANNPKQQILHHDEL